MKTKNLYFLALFISTFSIFFFPTLLYAQSTTPWSFYNNPSASNAMDIYYSGVGATNPALRILTNGYVGIGAITPTRPLQVHNTSADNQVYLSSNGPSLRFGNNAALGASTINAIIALGTSASQYLGGANDLNIYTASAGNVILGSNSVERMRIDTSGNVGIGTSASGIGGKLDIQATGDDTSPVLRLRQSNASAYGFDLGIDNNVDGGLYFYANNNGAQSISLKLSRNNGKVGIRTAGAPVADLHIKQTANAQYNGGITLERADTGNQGAIFMGSDNKLYLMTGAGFSTVDTSGRFDIHGNARIDNYLAINGYEPGACGTNYGLCVGGPSGGQSVWNNTSDGRLKKNITPISHALEKVMALQGVYFDFIETDGAYKNLPKGHQLGYIAQQVEPILPEVVSTGGDGMKMMSYANITALLGEGIKEQQKQIEDQNAKIKSLSADIELLKEEIKNLKK